MPNSFQKTVNLKEKPRPGRGEEIDNLYNSEKNELQKISQPKPRKDNGSFFRKVLFFLAIILVFASVYFLFFRGGIFHQNPQKNGVWRAVKLKSGETFYGQVKNTETDPVVMSNVYYNYDQQKGDGTTTPENNTLRLVKKGGETYGPNGTIEFIRCSVDYMEPMKDDSEVLKAILNYEK